MQSILMVVLLGILSGVSATSMYNYTEDFFNAVVGCLEEMPLSLKELDLLGNISEAYNKDDNEDGNEDDDEDDSDIEVPRCLLACAYKKVGAMDDEGKLSPTGLRNLTSKYYPDDAEKMKMTEDFIKTCLKVNDEPVSDGKKGCDRAKMMTDCGEDFADFEFV